MVTEIDFSDRRVKLVDESLDLAILITSRLAPLDVARRISRSRWLAVASPEYLRRYGEPKYPGELAERECLIHMPTGQAGWAFLVDGSGFSRPWINARCGGLDGPPANASGRLPPNGQTIPRADANR